MKKHFSFSHLLHKDKLMMLVSLILAIIIWVLVVYNQGSTQERTVSGVPVSITLTPYASEDLKLRIVDGADAVATVRVEGTRSAVGTLRAQDITVTADTSAVLKEGTYKLPLRVTSSGNCKVLGVVGDDGSSNTVTITCDVWSEKPFTLTAEDVEYPNLSLGDSEKLIFGTPSVSGAAISKEGTVVVSGPKSLIRRIVRIAAVIPDEEKITETTPYVADLVAYDTDDRPVESVTFLNAEDGKVNVVVPVLEYHNETLSVTVKNAPASLKDVAMLSENAIEVWALPSEWEEYIADIRNSLSVDFDRLLADGEDVSVPIELKRTGIRSITESLSMELDLSPYTNKTVNITLSEENIQILNCPEGYAITLEQGMLFDVVLCGKYEKLKKVDPAQLRIVVDVAGLSVGHHSVKVRIESDAETLWTYYGDNGYELQIAINQQ
ncbi:MAG: hypothetical protein IKL13_05310 [Clostridia bacterium]|nr:hypothetical protein [Clostridia bacterium]